MSPGYEHWRTMAAMDAKGQEAATRTFWTLAGHVSDRVLSTAKLGWDSVQTVNQLF